MTTVQLLITVAMISVGTMSMRFLPYILFPAGKPTPKFIQYLGKVLPGAVFAMLLVYSLKDVTILSGSHGIPELIGIAVTVGLHLWKKQMMISMAGGTIVYMLLVQLVFV